MHVGTFSIAAYDVASGRAGVAVSTRMPAIGALAVFTDAASGSVATQALINPLLGVDGLELLEEHSAEQTLRRLLDADPGADSRQVSIVDRHGGSAAHTGTETHPWSGHRTGPGFAVAGNMLVDGRTIDAMVESFEATADEPLHERLLLSLEAGQRAGGDRRGKQSAALRVSSGEPYPYLDLRVDDHPEPVAELRRVYEVAKRELLPFVEALPTRANPHGRFHELLGLPDDDPAR
ncbi:DUF1028 domain-containing protein [Saccharopolyspora endophytica]|uniref:DUF1028 domain-containing protein n=1 Tax=Saccharopolyspora endophytica TaxID=543886 RepID=A0ABS5DPV0_9PSEU|nr:DUF1028 domain-containing protein [Saccharopolyspora endophytica]MBQ0928316.1 DUF1028 domain-containing protein [Saccharopolyspora endophytica]